MWNLVDSFLNDIAEKQGHGRDSLSLVAELCSGGPTVQPDSSRNVVDQSVVAEPGANMPFGGYDSLGSKHIEYRVLKTEGTGKTKIPIVLYSFQHHPLAGCCRFALNRWVRCSDSWPTDLQKRGLDFRRAVAKQFGYSTLFVSKGPSGRASGELYNDFETIFDNGHNSLYSIKTA